MKIQSLTLAPGSYNLLLGDKIVCSVVHEPVAGEDGPI
jgi:hypothetical protein